MKYFLKRFWFCVLMPVAVVVGVEAEGSSNREVVEMEGAFRFSLPDHFETQASKLKAKSPLSYCDIQFSRSTRCLWLPSSATRGTKKDLIDAAARIVTEDFELKLGTVEFKESTNANDVSILRAFVPAEGKDVTFLAFVAFQLSNKRMVCYAIIPGELQKEQLSRLIDQSMDSLKVGK